MGDAKWNKVSKDKKTLNMYTVNRREITNR